MPEKRNLKLLLVEIGVAVGCAAALSTLAMHAGLIEWWHDFSLAHPEWEIGKLLGVAHAIVAVAIVLGIYHLIALKRLMKKMEQANASIRQHASIVNRQEKLVSLGELAGGMAHEINNALQPIIGLGNFVKEGLKKSYNKKHLAYMETILDSAEHARKVIENILAFTQTSSLELSTEKASSVLGQAVRFGANMMPPTVSIEMSGFFDDDPLTIDCNLTALCQIFLNLFKNASYAMNKSGIIKVVYGESVMPLDPGILAVTVTVTDTGSGMNEETLKNIFEPLYTTKELHKGTGLGLSVVHNLMREHKGQIVAHSVVNKGTTFTLYFPVVINSTPPSEAPNGSQ